MGNLKIENVFTPYFKGGTEEYDKYNEDIRKQASLFKKSNSYMKEIMRIITYSLNENLIDKFISTITARELFYNQNKKKLDNHYSSEKTYDELFWINTDVNKETFIIKFDKDLLISITELRKEIENSYNLDILLNKKENNNSIILIKNYNLLFASLFIFEPEFWLELILNDLSNSKNEDENSIVQNLKPLYFDVLSRTRNEYIKTYNYNYVSDEFPIFNYSKIFGDSLSNIKKLIGTKCNDNKKLHPNKLSLNDEYSIQGLINLIYVLLSLNKSETLDSLLLKKSIEKTIKESITKRKSPPYSKINFDASVPKMTIPIEMKEKIIMLFFHLDHNLNVFDHVRQKDAVNIDRISRYFDKYIQPYNRNFSKSTVRDKLKEIKGKNLPEKELSKHIGLKLHQIKDLMLNSVNDIEEFLKNLKLNSTNK